MRNIIIVIILSCVSLMTSAIDRIQSDTMSFQNIIGKRILLPTYNNGVNKLNFVYDVSVLKTGNFNYKSYSPLQVLGVPITVNSYNVINKGKKKKEALCLTVTDDNNHQAVLYFPMYINNSDFVGQTISELFYGDPKTTTNSAREYNLSTISIPYFLADDIINFEKNLKDSIVFPNIGYEGMSKREYVFGGFKFSKRLNFGFRTSLDKEFRYHVLGYYTGEKLNAHNIFDNLYAILKKDDKIYYMQVNAINSKYGDNDGICTSDLKESLLSLDNYKLSFATQYDSEKIAKLNKQFASKDMFFVDNENFKKNEYVCISYDSTFSKYRIESAHYIANKYFYTEGVRLIRFQDKDGNVFYSYNLVGQTNTPHDSTKIYVAFELNKSLLSAFKDGAQQRQIDKIEEENKIREEQEWQNQLAQEKENYKNNLIRKYGRENANIILSGKVRIGFTKAMCKEAWGAPNDINTTITTHGTFEQWVYGLGCYLYFNGNRLVTIQN